MKKRHILAALLCAVLALCAAPALASEVEDAITEDLLTGLLKESARIIKDAYGIDGRFGNEMTVMWDDDPESEQQLGANERAAAGGRFGFPYETKLYLNHEYFRDPGATSTPEGRTLIRLTILHELTHGMQFTSEPGLLTLIAEDPTQRNIGKAQFLYEGMAEYAADGNDRLLNYVRNRRKVSPTLTDKQITEGILEKMTLAMSTIPGSGGYSKTDFSEMELFYIGSYLATRWFDTQSKKYGGTGVKGLINYLETHNLQNNNSSSAFDAAIKHASNGLWEDYSAFANSTINQEKNTAGGFYQFVLGVLNEDPAVDAGRVGGYYASGGLKQTRRAIADSLAVGPRDEAPLRDYGFDKMTIFGKTFQDDTQQPGGGSGGSGGGTGGGSAPVPAPDPGAHDSDVDERTSSSSWSSKTGGDVTVRVEVDFSKFTGAVSFDGVPLVQDTDVLSRDFVARPGSTVITIWEDAVRTRVKASGAHYVSVGFADGVASHKITASVPGSPEPAPGKSGSGGGGCAAGAAAAAAVALIAAVRRRR